MSKFKMTLLVIPAALVVGGGYFAWHKVQSGSSRADEIPVAQVRRGPFEVTLTSIGEIRAAKSSVLASPFEGKILKLLPEGTRVQTGDPVVWFETTELEEELEAEQAQLELDKKDLQGAIDAYELSKVQNQYTLEAERTKVAVAEQDYADAQQKYEAEKVLFERKISPQTKLDERRIALLQSELNLRNAKISLAKVEENLDANLRNAQREIEKVRLRVEKAQNDVDEEKRELESAVVVAPSPGEISYLKIWKSGQVAKVVEGDQVWRRSNIVEIPDTSQMMVVLPVNEIDISRIESGQPARVTLIALPTETFSGVVESKSIVPISDPAARSWDSTGQNQPGPREFEVKIRLSESNEMLRQGMTASAEIVIERLDSALYVPLEALFERDGKQGLWLGEGNEVDFHPMKVIASNDNFAAVEGELSEGDAVFLSDPSAGSPTSAPARLVAGDEGSAAPTAPASGGG